MTRQYRCLYGPGPNPRKPLEPKIPAFSKRTELILKEISNREKDISLAEIARKYGVSRQRVSEIKKRKELENVGD